MGNYWLDLNNKFSHLSDDFLVKEIVGVMKRTNAKAQLDLWRKLLENCDLFFCYNANAEEGITELWTTLARNDSDFSPSQQVVLVPRGSTVTQAIAKVMEKHFEELGYEWSE